MPQRVSEILPGIEAVTPMLLRAGEHQTAVSEATEYDDIDFDLPPGYALAVWGFHAGLAKTDADAAACVCHLMAVPQYRGTNVQAQASSDSLFRHAADFQIVSSGGGRMLTDVYAFLPVPFLVLRDMTIVTFSTIVGRVQFGIYHQIVTISDGDVVRLAGMGIHR